MQPPSVVIAANPYEAELVRRALVPTGLRVVVAEGGEGALEAVRAETPLVLVIAFGIFGSDPLELLRLARTAQPHLAIFVIGDREGELPDEDAAARAGASRLFLRPVEIDALADAIEKCAVEAEMAGEVAEAMREFDARTDTIDAELLVEEAIVELEADFAEDEPPPVPLVRFAAQRLPRQPTEVLKGVIDVPASTPRREVAPPDKVELEWGLASDDPTPLPIAAPPPIETPPPLVLSGAAGDAEPSAMVLTPEPLLRVDDTLSGIGLQSLVVASDFVDYHRRPASEEPGIVRGVADEPPPPRLPEALKRGEPVDHARPAFAERSTLARRLENELSAAERRLFPNSPSTASAPREEYEDALGDIDLDALGLDTIPGIGADALDPAFDLKPPPPPSNGHAKLDPAPPEPASAVPPTAAPQPPASLPDDEGDLATTDVATLFAALHAAGFSGAVTLQRGDGDRTLFFDAGVPVAARSTFAHDRLPDLLLREGVITREQYARARELGQAGRSVAQKLVEQGLVKSSELFATLRRHTEEILYSCLAWERGRYRLTHEEAPTEDRVRLGAHPWALFIEGVRRKYSLERLVELVGPPETVLSPTTLLPRALEEGALTAAERARAELIDGERTLVELQLGAVGMPLAEVGLYALAWALLAIGAARVGAEAEPPGLGVRSLPTLVTAAYGAADRRTRPRPIERPRDRDVDRAIDRDRVLAKRTQVQDGDYFAILGLDRDASAHEVARAFERLKREFAPERFADALQVELAEALVEIGEALDEAHRVLADDAVRASYRAHLLPA